MADGVEKEEKVVGSWMERVEIETSVPFHSVKEAIGLFGGRGSWKPQNKYGHQSHEVSSEECTHFTDVNITIVEKQTEQLTNDFVVKEKETLKVLRELEMTKSILDDLKVKLYKHTSEATIPSEKSMNLAKVHPLLSSGCARSPRMILMELKQAKENLAGYRSIDLLNDSIEKDDVNPPTNKMSFLEKELSQTQKMIDQAKQMLQFTIDTGVKEGIANPQDGDGPAELQMRSEVNQINEEVEGSAPAETYRMSEEMEQTVDNFKIDEKNIEADIGIVETEVLIAAESSIMFTVEDNGEEELCRKRIEAAVAQVEETKKTEMKLLKKVEEAKADINSSRKALEVAIQRVEATFNHKHAFDNIPRRRRSKLIKKRRSIHRSPRFKSSPSQRRDARTYNCLDASRPTLSIGQILRRKLMGPEEFQIRSKGEPEVSLREILSIHRSLSAQNSATVASATFKQLQSNKKKFHFKGFLAKS